MLAALHALGNLDVLIPTAVESVKNLLSQSNIPVWLEVQAMDAFRRDPCEPTLKEVVRKILSDSSKTDQVRIHAYLAASRCITPELLNTIQEVFKQADSAGGLLLFNTRKST